MKKPVVYGVWIICSICRKPAEAEDAQGRFYCVACILQKVAGGWLRRVAA